jgi:hypothetical protein
MIHMAEDPVPLAKFYEMSPGTGTQGPTIAKAVIAVTGSLGVAIAAAVADGSVTVWEIVLGVLAALGTGAAVWATSNEPARK